MLRIQGNLGKNEMVRLNGKEGFISGTYMEYRRFPDKLPPEATLVLKITFLGDPPDTVPDTMLTSIDQC